MDGGDKGERSFDGETVFEQGETDGKAGKNKGS